MIALLGCQLIGCWRIAEADLWHREHLGLGGLAHILKAKRDLSSTAARDACFAETATCPHRRLALLGT